MTDHIRSGAAWPVENYEIFYSQLEEGVREYIRALRNAGINTQSSCHHNGVIQCDSIDPTSEIMIIKSVLVEMDVGYFTIGLHYDSNANCQAIEIKSDDFKLSDGTVTEE